VRRNQSHRSIAGRDKDFDRLLYEAETASFEGWDFSWIQGRMIEESPRWSFREIVRVHFPTARRLLDLGTGGGEFLSSLSPLPAFSVATESYPPNFLVAGRRLKATGVDVVAVEGAPDNDEWQGEGGRLPFGGGSFDLIVSRHESYSPTEVARVLMPGGSFVTEQLGGNSGEEARFRKLFGRPPGGRKWGLADAIRQIEGVGVRVTRSGEEFPTTKFLDVGALAYYLKAVPWIIEGFGIDRDRSSLRRIHDQIGREGALEIRGHLYWLEARAR
jgi:SAM-dependent methyltransferase